MHIKSVYIKEFRNLKDFKIDFSLPKTVLIGLNASGKSNFIEAIVLIFKYLDLYDKEINPAHWFEYEIIYTINDKKVKITRTLDNEKEKMTYQVSKHTDMFGEEVYEDIRGFKEHKDKYLPKYIFAYYSGLGNSNRLEEHFLDHKKKFAEDAMKLKDKDMPNPPRLLYAELIHSQLSLFSFFIDNDDIARNFLKEHLSIEDFHSILLTIQEPDWSTNEKKKKEPKFFGSEGVVKNLLYHLHDKVAFAPFRDKIENKSGLWEKKGKKTIDAVYLYIDKLDGIRHFVKENNWTMFQFFHILNTANVSKLLTREGINIRIAKTYAGKLLFKDLSEGEQQLLTVLGLMRFTYTEEALFLLDESDTHLNPLWRWKYMDFIDEIVLHGKKEHEKASVQVIMSSHEPLTIGSLDKEAVRQFIQDGDKIIAQTPMESPKGLGVAGILTEIFDLPSTIDIETNKQLERRRHIESMLFNLEKYNNPLPPNENYEDLKEELEKLNKVLDNLGFSRVTRDPLYQKFQAKFDKKIEYKKAALRPLTPQEKEEQDRWMEEIMKELFEEEGL